MTDQYDADYFLRGKETGKSLYTDYRWLPELTLPMVRCIIEHLGIRCDDTVLDFGCARGYVVRAFREMGYEAYGIDASEWAIANCDPEVKSFVTGVNAPVMHVDWVIAKDVLEHVEAPRHFISGLLDVARAGLLVVVPLAPLDGGPYVVAEYEEDVTHVHRLTLTTWVGMFVRPGWSVEARYRLRGVKDNYAQHERGNGFITCRRVSCR